VQQGPEALRMGGKSQRYLRESVSRTRCARQYYVLTTHYTSLCPRLWYLPVEYSLPIDNRLSMARGTRYDGRLRIEAVRLIFANKRRMRTQAGLGNAPLRR
jgi:hypothetical protein